MQKKILINRHFNYIELVGQKRELSHPVTVAKPNREKDSSSFLARTQPMKIHELFVYYSLPNFLFPSI